MQLKQKVAQHLPEIKALATQYGFEQEIEAAIQKHAQFKLRVPFVGAFSAGKSSLLNRLLGEKGLLGVQVTPETCLPTEIFYSSQESIRLMSHQGVVAELTRQQLAEQDYSVIEGCWVEVGLPSPILDKYRDVVLVDMPGWDSGLAEHSLAIDNYIHLSGTYCLTVSASDGTLKQSIKEALAELKMLNKPVVLIINKADSVDEMQLPNIVDSITHEVTSHLSAPPINVLITSARKNHIDGIEPALAQIIDLSDSIYVELVLKHFYLVFELMIAKINILLNEENLSIEQAQYECDQVPKQLDMLKAQLDELISQIESMIPSCIDVTKTNLTNHLKTQLGTLSHCAMHGGNIQNEIATALRSAFLTMIEQDFKPKVARQLKSLQNINDIAPTHLDISTAFSATEEGTEAKGILLSQMVAFTLTKVLTLVPQLKPFGVIIHAIASYFTSEAERNMRQEQQREEANNYVLYTLIPQVVSQSESAIQANLYQIVEKVKAEITQETEQKALNKQEALMQLTQKLDAAKEQNEAQKQQYHQSLQSLAQWREQLSEAD